MEPIKAGIIIKKMRTEKDLTLRDLSKLSGVGFSTIHDIESGKSQNPKIDTLEKISDVLNVHVSELLSDNEKLTIARTKLSALADEARKTLENDKFISSENNLSEKDIRINTVAAHLETKKITPKKLDLLNKYIDALFDEE